MISSGNFRVQPVLCSTFLTQGNTRGRNNPTFTVNAPLVQILFVIVTMKNTCLADKGLHGRNIGPKRKRYSMAKAQAVM
jgi:hypothetical protein